jgi:hypothetical protein
MQQQQQQQLQLLRRLTGHGQQAGVSRCCQRPQWLLLRLRQSECSRLHAVIADKDAPEPLQVPFAPAAAAAEISAAKVWKKCGMLPGCACCNNHGSLQELTIGMVLVHALRFMPYAGAAFLSLDIYATQHLNCMGCYRHLHCALCDKQFAVGAFLCCEASSTEDKGSCCLCQLSAGS